MAAGLQIAQGLERRNKKFVVRDQKMLLSGIFYLMAVSSLFADNAIMESNIKKTSERDDNHPIPEGMLVLVKGRGASGEAHHAYAVIPVEKYDSFLNAQAAGTYDLSAFGTVLYHGSGLEPPSEVQREMEQKYGALHDFERQLTQAVQEADV